MVHELDICVLCAFLRRLCVHLRAFLCAFGGRFRGHFMAVLCAF